MAKSLHDIQALDHIRGAIFDFLNIDELRNVASVCHAWKATAAGSVRRRTKVTSPELETLALTVDQVLDVFPHVRTLNLASASFQIFQIRDPQKLTKLARQLRALWLSPITPKRIIKILFGNAEQLEILNARTIPYIDDNILSTLDAKRLRKLDLSGCYHLTDASVQQAVANNQKLETLLLKGCIGITADLLVHFPHSRLKTLSVDGSRGTFTTYSILSLLNSCPTLSKLELAHFRELKSSSSNLLRLSQKLHSLKFTTCSGLQPEIISRIKANKCSVSFGSPTSFSAISINNQRNDAKSEKPSDSS